MMSHVRTARRGSYESRAHHETWLSTLYWSTLIRTRARAKVGTGAHACASLILSSLILCRHNRKIQQKLEGCSFACVLSSTVWGGQLKQFILDTAVLRSCSYYIN